MDAEKKAIQPQTVDIGRELTIEDILGAELQEEKVYIPYLKGYVTVREVPADEIGRYTAMLEGDPEAKKVAIAYLVSISVIKPDGTRMFSTQDQVNALKKKGFGLLVRIQDAAERVNGLSKEARNASKNGSGEAATSASPTDSRSS